MKLKVKNVYTGDKQKGIDMLSYAFTLPTELLNFFYVLYKKYHLDAIDFPQHSCIHFTEEGAFYILNKMVGIVFSLSAQQLKESYSREECLERNLHQPDNFILKVLASPCNEEGFITRMSVSMTRVKNE